MSAWWERIKPYIDSYGLVTLNDKAEDGVGAGNLLLHTGLYYVAVFEAGEFPDRMLSSILSPCQVDGYPGLFWRSPYKIGDVESHDDYIGIAAAAYFYAPYIAQQIVEHGELYKWCYNSKKPEVYSLSFDHDRFPGQVTFYRMCAHLKVSIWEAVPLALRSLVLSFSKDGDAAIHAYLFMSVGKAVFPLLFYPMWFISPFRSEIGPRFKSYLGAGQPLGEIDR